MKLIIPQFKATDKPYSVVAVLYMVSESFTLLVEGNTTGNIDAKEDVIPPSITTVDNMKPYMSFFSFLIKNKPNNPVK